MPSNRAPATVDMAGKGTPAIAAAERGEFADAKTLVGLLWLGRERASKPGGA